MLHIYTAGSMARATLQKGLEDFLSEVGNYLVFIEWSLHEHHFQILTN